MNEPQKQFEHLIKPIDSMAERRLLERRFDQEFKVAEIQTKAAQRVAELKANPWHAQLVKDRNGNIGVAVKGARFVCPLPKSYELAGLRLNVHEDGRLIVTCKHLPPLVIDPDTGRVTRL